MNATPTSTPAPTVPTGTTPRQIVMIDDDAGLGELVSELLGRHGLSVQTFTDPVRALAHLRTAAVDLVILDVMLPRRDGFDVCKELRAQSEVPIVMLSARGDVNDRVRGLELGADDYLAKPFEPRELLARILTVLRRGRAVRVERELRFDDLAIDAVSRTATLAGQAVPLTTAEFDLLALMAGRPGATLSRDQISEALRGAEWAVYSRSIDIVMSRLRQKLGDDPKKPRFIKTIWGTGYMFIGRPAGGGVTTTDAADLGEQ